MNALTMIFRRLIGVVFRLAGMAALAIACAGCGPDSNQGAEAPDEPGTLALEMSAGPLDVIISATPNTVSLHRDVLLTILVSAPEGVKPLLPSLEGRLTGFTATGVYDDAPATRGKRSIYKRHARLTPEISSEYRLGAMAIGWLDGGETSWAATQPVVFKEASGDARGKVAPRLEPVWIYPPFKTVAVYILMALGVVGLAVLAWKLIQRANRAVQLARMSPKERALKELSRLLAKDLVGRNRVKEFYIELTLIVRRYIERAHSIRAPEQTTEEFLEAAGKSGRFSEEALGKLREFLQAADLVKFAAYRPEGGAVEEATRTAREYITTDAESDTPPPEEKKT